MKNKHFLDKLLKDNNDYWIVAKENYTREYFEDKRLPDDILFISVPLKIKRPVNLNDVTIGEIEKIEDIEVTENVFLSNNYSPFQLGIRISEFSDGFPLDFKSINPKEFLIKALAIESNNIEDYRNLVSQNDEV